MQTERVKGGSLSQVWPPTLSLDILSVPGEGQSPSVEDHRGRPTGSISRAVSIRVRDRTAHVGIRPRVPTCGQLGGVQVADKVLGIKWPANWTDGYETANGGGCSASDGDTSLRSHQGTNECLAPSSQFPAGMPWGPEVFHGRW